MGQRATMSCEVVRLLVFIKHVLVLCGALCKPLLDPSNRILGSPLCAPRTLPSEFHSETSSINNPNVFYCFISFEMHFKMENNPVFLTSSFCVTPESLN